MSQSVFDQPTQEQLAGFVAGDPVAQDEVARLLLPQIVRWAFKHFPALPREEVESMVYYAFAEACRNHKRYAPERSLLTTYLIRLVRFRLIDLYDELREIEETEETDLKEREKSLQLTYNELDETDAATHAVRDSFFKDATQLLEGAEREFLTLMWDGEFHQEAFAAILTRYGYSDIDLAHEVKNTKERIHRKLALLARERGYKPEDLLGR